jgi:glycosyltransferase involved in cell wall biosynthesis
MKIGIEAERANYPHKTGVEHYAKQVILQLAELDSQNQYILYLRTKPQDWFLKLPKNFTIKILGYGPIPFPYLWTQIRLSFEMLFFAPDVLFIPAASLPLIHPKKSVITVHDVAWRLYPETFKILKRWYLEYTAWFACRFANTIIAVSSATKDDLVKFYKVDEDKIEIVYHGYTPGQSNESNQGSEIIQKLPDKYIVYLGTIQPRKNVIGLIDAFTQLKLDHPELPHKLVIAGGMGWKTEQTLEKIKSNSDVIYLGHIADEDRWPMLKRASLYVLPSFYEGFGMPILEAFQMHTPVATSNISSMPEVAGDAAIYFDPNNISDIKRAMQSVLFDSSLADSLRSKGEQRLKLFSWHNCGQGTLNVLIK